MAGNRRPPPSRPQLNFQDHCLLCLQPQSHATISEILEKNPKNLKSFQPVLHYLTGSGHGEGEEEGVPQVDNLPPLCWTCYDITAELYRLHEQLLSTMRLIQQQTVWARRVVTKTLLPNPPQPSPRSQFYERIRTRGRPEEVETVKKFVANLHEKIFTEVTGKKNVQFPFPTRVSTGFVPNLKLPVSFQQQLQPKFSPKFPQKVAAPTSTSVNVGRQPVVTASVLISQPSTPVQVDSILDPSDSDLDDNIEEEPENTVVASSRGGSPNMAPGSTSMLGSSELIILPPTEQPADVKYENEDVDMEVEDEEAPACKEEVDKDVDVKSEMDSDSSEHSFSESDNDKTAHPEPTPTPKPDPDQTISSVISSILHKPRPHPPKWLQNLTPAQQLARRIQDRERHRCYSRGLPYIGVGRCVCDPTASILQHMESHVKDFATKCLNPACSKVFSCRRKMEYHVLHKGVNCRKALDLQKGHYFLNKCEECQYETKRGNAFRNHLQKHEHVMTEKNFICPIPACLEKYALRQSVEEHIFTHNLRPAKTEQKCPVCKGLLEMGDVGQHLQDAHQAKEIIPCKWCSFLFPDRISLLDHLQESHRGLGLALSCDLCNEEEPNLKYDRVHSLRHHYFTVHQIGSQFLCEHCNKEFYSPASLSNHVRARHESKKRSRSRIRFTCDLCPVSYGEAERLKYHKFKKHGVGDPLSCRFCSKSFLTQNSHLRHEADHAGLGRTYRCIAAGCGKVFRTLSSFKLHKHPDPNSSPTKFVCDICGKVFRWEGKLKKHLDSGHLEKPPQERTVHVCELCGESFTTPTNLRRHQLIHSGERPFSCDVCGQKFRQRNNMQTHLRSHQKKGVDFKPKVAWQRNRKRVVRKKSAATE